MNRLFLKFVILISSLFVGLSTLCFAAPRYKEIANSHYRYQLDVQHPAIVLVDNRKMGRNAAILRPNNPQSLFSVAARELDAAGKVIRYRSFSSQDFTTTHFDTTHKGSSTITAWTMVRQFGADKLTVGLTISADSSMESIWSCTLKCSRNMDVDFAFPMMDGLKLGPDPKDAFYFHPRYSGLLNDVPIRLATTYGQYARMQAMCAYNPSGAARWQPGVVYMVTHDTNMMRKTYELEKRQKGVTPLNLRDDYGFAFAKGFKADDGISMAVNWTRIALQPNKPYRVPDVAVGIGAGDWRTALSSYRSWTNGWYPEHRRGAALSFAHTSFDLFSQPNCDAALAEIDKHPYPDYMQFMVQNKRLLGEYGNRDDWSLAELQRFVAECKKRGIAANHYVEGYIASKDSQVWKDHGTEWGQMQGEQYQTAFANQCMWLCQPEWHRWLEGETSRLARELKLDSIYLDELGWGTGDKSHSDNPAHHPGRYQPDGAMEGVRDLLRVVRGGLDKVNPSITMYTEGPAVDCLLPYLDGVEDYTCVQLKSNPAAYRIPVHFMRFVYPDFKFADIPDGTPAEQELQLKMCLFNGTGSMSSGLAPLDSQSWLNRSHTILKENRDAFSDLHPTPLVSTMVNRVYCNRFTASNKRIYTLWNGNDYLVSGQLLVLPKANGEHWVDLLNNINLQIDASHSGDRAVTQIAPHDVAVIASFPQIIRFRRDGEHMWLTSPKLASGDELVLSLIKPDGAVAESKPFHANSSGFSLADISSDGRFRVVMKLYRNKLLRDVAVLPELNTLDIAIDAVPSGSVRSNETKPINGAAAGSYTLKWDDKVRWVQYAWKTPQRFNTSALRCASYFGDVYTPQIYRYLVSDDGQTWKPLLEVNKVGHTNFDDVDQLPTVTARYLRLEVVKGGIWADATEIERWRIYCKPAEK